MPRSSSRFDDHHAELASMLLDEIDALTAKSEALTLRIEQLIAEIPAAQAPADPGPGSGVQPSDPSSAPLSVVARLDEITGIGVHAAHVIIAEVGLDMARFPTAAHLASWTKVCPRTIQSGPKRRSGKTGKGNHYLKRVLGEAGFPALLQQFFQRRWGAFIRVVPLSSEIRLRATIPTEAILPW